MIAISDWVQRFTYSKQTDTFFLKSEACPDRLNRPGDHHYLALGLYGTRVPFETEPTERDIQRNVYYYPTGLYGVGGNKTAGPRLSWKEKTWGIFIGRFAGWNKYQGFKEALIDSTDLKRKRQINVLYED